MISLYSKSALIAECERYRLEVEGMKELLTLLREMVDDALETLEADKEEGKLDDESYEHQVTAMRAVLDEIRR